MLSSYEGKIYEDVQNDFFNIMKTEINNPQLQYKATISYKEYLRKLEKNNKRCKRCKQNSILSLNAFVAVQPYLAYVKEKTGYAMGARNVACGGKKFPDISRLSLGELKVYKEVQQMLWERIENYVVSCFPEYIKKDRNKKAELYQIMYTVFAEKMLFQYEPNFSKRNSPISPTTYFKAYIYRAAFSIYQTEVSEMTKYDIDKNVRIQRAIQGLEVENISPSVENIVERTGYSNRVVANSLGYMQSRVYLDSPMDAEGTDYRESFPATDLTPEELILKKDSIREVVACLEEVLNETEQKIVYLRLDFEDMCDGKYVPYRQMAEQLGMTVHQLRKIYNSAIEKLQNGIALITTERGHTT